MEPTRTPFTRMAFRQQLLSTPAIHPGAGQPGATTLAAPRPRPHAPDELSRHTRTCLPLGRSVCQPMLRHRMPAGKTVRNIGTTIPGYIPIAIWPRQMAAARNCCHVAAACTRGHRTCGRVLPRLRGRLPRNPGRNRHGKPPCVPGGRRHGLSLHWLPQRQPPMD